MYSAVAEDAEEFEGEVREKKDDKEDIYANEDVSVERNFHICTEEECVCDDSRVYENIEKMSDSPDTLWNHGFDPTREDKDDESVESHDAKGK